MPTPSQDMPRRLDRPGGASGRSRGGPDAAPRPYLRSHRAKSGRTGASTFDLLHESHWSVLPISGTSERTNTRGRRTSGVSRKGRRLVEGQSGAIDLVSDFIHPSSMSRPPGPTLLANLVRERRRFRGGISSDVLGPDRTGVTGSSPGRATEWCRMLPHRGPAPPSGAGRRIGAAPSGGHRTRHGTGRKEPSRPRGSG